LPTFGVFGIEFRERLTPESDITASFEFGLKGNVTLNVLDVAPSRDRRKSNQQPTSSPNAG